MNEPNYRLTLSELDNDQIEREQNLKKDDQLYRGEENSSFSYIYPDPEAFDYRWFESDEIRDERHINRW